MIEPISIILDTHVWVWLMSGDDRQIDQVTRLQIEQTAYAGNVYVSAISLWEVAMLTAKGRLQFPSGCRNWLRRALEAPGISLAPITLDIAVDSTLLPAGFPGDPADRLIIASARNLQSVLFSKDKRIKQFAEQSGYIQVMTW